MNQNLIFGASRPSAQVTQRICLVICDLVKGEITINGITLVEEDRALIAGFNSGVVQLHADHLKYLT